HPNNILICQGNPKITNFEISNSVSNIVYTDPQSTLLHDKKSDVFSLATGTINDLNPGVIFWKISSSKMPYAHIGPETFIPHILQKIGVYR
ncbi:14003_t:CDS:1, partial [Gigaspora rosea]